MSAMNPWSKTKKIMVTLASLAFIVLVSLPFVLQSDRLRADITTVSRGQVIRTVEAEGVFGLGESRTLTAVNGVWLTGEEEQLLLGRLVKKGEVLLRNEAGETLVAPIDGLVTNVVCGNPGLITVTACQYDRITLLAPAEEADSFEVGQKVVFSESLSGSILAVADGAVTKDGVTGLPVLVEFSDSAAAEDFASAGEKVTASIQVEVSEEKAVYLPKKCFLTDASGNLYCYAVDGKHKAYTVFPSVGIIGDDRVEILSGLSVDQRVVLEIPDGIREGIVVLPHFTESIEE